MMTILIADDHSVVRRGLKTILSEAYPHSEISEVADTNDLLNQVMKSEWSIIISDISMPGRSGVEILKQLKELAPNTPVLMLSVHPPEQYALRCIKSGASGYLTKESAPEQLVNAVETLIAGRRYITPEIAEILADAHTLNSHKKLHETLSDREFEVLKFIATGKTISEIAEKLIISVNTVSTYRSRILEKMRMHSNAEIIKYSLENNLV